LAELLGGDRATAEREYGKGLLRARDADIDEAIRDLRFWTSKLRAVIPASELRRALVRTRSQLLQVRTPRHWARTPSKVARKAAALRKRHASRNSRRTGVRR
jgi:hypothetical protein